ncbi:MAG: hypothetical protein H5U06_11590, partial [Candidatus Aminicenantes bacterium]|nr:hypothetical protein [Candidatus Aminicenantes bacterium]
RAWKVIRGEKQAISEHQARTSFLLQQIRHLMQIKLKDLNSSWENLTSSLDNLSPLNIIKKGYTICWKAGGLMPVQKATEVEPGEEIIVSFYRGELNCQVKEVDPKIKIESKFIKETK